MERVPQLGGLRLERDIKIMLLHQVLGNPDAPSDFHTVFQEGFCGKQSLGKASYSTFSERPLRALNLLV